MTGIRIGYGYDVHRLVKGRRLVIGGVHIPAEFGFDGHSDADVLLHAIADALLGAAALGDIGKHFPNTDPHVAGISSVLLLEKVAAMIAASGYAAGNIDATVVLERPKLLPHIPAMQTIIATALGIPPEAVSIKATTGEGMGFAGRGEGGAAHAVALIHSSQ